MCNDSGTRLGLTVEVPGDFVKAVSEEVRHDLQPLSSSSPGLPRERGGHFTVCPEPEGTLWLAPSAVAFLVLPWHSFHASCLLPIPAA